MSSRMVAADHACRRVAQFENHPALPALLEELTPRTVALLFEEIGVADAGVLMTMLPTRALLLAFDESIWKISRPGVRETIAVRDVVDFFGAWTDIGEEFLLQKLQAMNEDYLTMLLSRIVKVESHSRYAVYADDPGSFVQLCDDDRERIGPYIVMPVLDDDEDVSMNVVRAFWSADSPKALRILGRITDLSNPDDSTRGSTATLHDIEAERDSFREEHGFVTVDGARAFLEYAERLTACDIAALDEYDGETRRYLDRIARTLESPKAASHPIVTEGFEDDESTPSTAVVPIASCASTATLRLQLEDAQLLPRQGAIVLLKDARTSKEPTLAVELRRLADQNAEGLHARERELAYLANVLRHAPGRIDPLSDGEAREAAFAICNLGFELATEACADELNREPGLIRQFLRGWNALSSTRSRVIGVFARALSQSATLAPGLQSEATARLSDLRRALESRCFEAAREAVMFLSIVFDSRVCRAIAPLLDTIPRLATLLEGGGGARQERWVASKADLQMLERLLDSLRLQVRESAK